MSMLQKKPKHGGDCNNADKESAVYADLEKRLEAIRKQ
jgi:hypothetical protein